MRKGVDYPSGFQGQSKDEKIQKSRYVIGNVSEKDLPKIIKEFEIIERLPYEKKRPNLEPTNSYFHI